MSTLFRFQINHDAHSAFVTNMYGDDSVHTGRLRRTAFVEFFSWSTLIRVSFSGPFFCTCRSFSTRRLTRALGVLCDRVLTELCAAVRVILMCANFYTNAVLVSSAELRFRHALDAVGYKPWKSKKTGESLSETPIDGILTARDKFVKKGMIK